MWGKCQRIRRLPATVKESISHLAVAKQASGSRCMHKNPDRAIDNRMEVLSTVCTLVINRQSEPDEGLMLFLFIHPDFNRKGRFRDSPSSKLEGHFGSQNKKRFAGSLGSGCRLTTMSSPT